MEMHLNLHCIITCLCLAAVNIWSLFLQTIYMYRMPKSSFTRPHRNYSPTVYALVFDRFTFRLLAQGLVIPVPPAERLK